MTTISLKVSDKVIEKFLWLLKHFNPEEVEIIEDDNFNENKANLQKTLHKIRAGKATFYSIEEAKKRLSL